MNKEQPELKELKEETLKEFVAKFCKKKNKIKNGLASKKTFEFDL